MGNKTVVQIGSKTWQCAHYQSGAGKSIDLSAIYTVPLPAFPSYNGLLMDGIYDSTFYGSFDTSFFAFNADIIWIRASGYVSGVSPRVKTNGVSFTGLYTYTLIVNMDESSGVTVGNMATITPETRQWAVGNTLTWSFRGHSYSYLVNSYSVPGPIWYSGTLSTDGGSGVPAVEVPQSALIVFGATLSTGGGVGIDLNSMMMLMMVMMMMGMMMKVIK